MEFDNFKGKLCKLGRDINIEISENQAKKFYDYMNLLLEWNKKINLTAIIEPDEVILKHFIDSLTSIRFLKGNEKIIDVGTGAGFPGIPIKIMFEDTNIVLADSLNKRINFLNEVISKLELKNIECIHQRAEDIGQNPQFREKFDIATSRAVANLTVLSEYLLPLVNLNGRMICLKGSNIEEEIKESRNAINILGGKSVEIDSFTLPSSDNSRNIIISRKFKNTPNIFPRKAGLPSKEPIK